MLEIKDMSAFLGYIFSKKLILFACTPKQIEILSKNQGTGLGMIHTQ